MEDIGNLINLIWSDGSRAFDVQGYRAVSMSQRFVLMYRDPKLRRVVFIGVFRTLTEALSGMRSDIARLEHIDRAALAILHSAPRSHVGTVSVSGRRVIKDKGLKRLARLLIGRWRGWRFIRQAKGG